ncbi:MAG: cobalamin biosynthesis protein CbiD [Epulopiscium sp.]|jgi:cobalt-precorrin-5B (C1)-methyltransferase|nr:cobalamin biosynthesis protein CbiD [Candidatus Epulonipiscium sp.]
MKNNTNDSVKQNKKKLRKGYTTGTCAAAASAAAVALLLGNEKLEEVTLVTPSGITLSLAVTKHRMDFSGASCAVQKDSGDDPDITNGIFIFAKAEKISEGFLIEGGEGIGRVTQNGLEQPVGSAAINRVPREMITQQVQQMCRHFGYEGGIQITISAPEGAELAKKTFNPRLGIEGGISILGSSGIVEPMSEKALLDSIYLEMKMRATNGAKYLILTPGNYGQDFLKKQLKIDLAHGVKISNFVGDALDYAVELNFSGILLLGHIGKLVKVAGGIMQTHSSYADCRMELLGLHTVLAGGDAELLREILACATTEAALEKIENAGYLHKTMGSLVEKINWHMQKRTEEKLETAVLLFSEKKGLLGHTENIIRILEKMK